MKTDTSPSNSPFYFDEVHCEYVCKGCGRALDTDTVLEDLNEAGLVARTMLYCPLCGYPGDGKSGDPEDPERYTHGSVECIDAIESALTPEEFRGFCKGNALKYIWRERWKGGQLDIDKAVDYLGRL